MATAQETIVTGLQALKVLQLGQAPDTAKNTYCLRQLNNFIRDLKGFGASLPLQDVRVSGSYTVTTQWPAVRLLCGGGDTVTLPESSDIAPAIADGFRVEVVDAEETADSSSITIARNGALIAGAASNYTISTEGGAVSLMWRADQGNWQVMADLALTDNLPFPTDFDQGIALLAAETYTLFGQSLSRSDDERARRAEQRLRARYKKPPPAQMDTAAVNIGGASGFTSLEDYRNGLV